MKSVQLKNVTLPVINKYVIKKIHLIGIGGAGMCGLAKILFKQGYYVTGSDIVKNDAIHYLLKLGIKVFLEHDCNNISKADIVVVSSAINLNNPEIQAAKNLKIPIMQRADVLSELMRYKYGIVIAGTHGKTTTTAMLVSIYLESGLDPTFINGGIIISEGVQARLGRNYYFIAEADESDKSFLRLFPVVGVITNIDSDHMDTYQKNFVYLKEAFLSFINNLPIYGYAVVCIDDPAIRDIVFNINNKKIITYGFNRNANFCVLYHQQYAGMSKFTVLVRRKKKLKVTLKMSGYHNVLNATAAIAVAIEEGIHDIHIVKAMFHFQGVNRRFENLGYYSLKYINSRIGKVMIIDDYGHHPSELDANIMTIRIGWPNKRLIMIFQPHRFTRTHALYTDFVKVLSTVDILLMLNIYSAGEDPIIGINSQSLCDSIGKYGNMKPIFIPNKGFLFQVLFEFLQNDDLILIQGAGTVGKIVRDIFLFNNKMSYSSKSNKMIKKTV